MRLLTVSGSLRAASINSAILDALAAVATSTTQVRRSQSIALLPLFNPDNEGLSIDSVAAWRGELAWADAVVFSTPEYAHGIPGALKNALDWVVGSGEFSRKPVALLQTSSRATHAPAALLEVLRTMDAHLPTEPLTTIELRSGATAESILADTGARAQLEPLLARLTSQSARLHDL